MTTTQLLEEIRKLGVDERLDLAVALWKELAVDYGDRIPLPDAHKRLIDARLAEHESNPDQTLSWSEVKAELLERLG